MKYIKVLILSLFVVTIFSGMVGCSSLKELNTDKYYLKVPSDAEKKEEFYIKDKKKEKFISYYYNNVDAYDKDGEKIQVKFFADKKLRSGAYLMISVKETKKKEVNDIIGYKEVQENELPNMVKENLVEK